MSVTTRFPILLSCALTATLWTTPNVYADEPTPAVMKAEGHWEGAIEVMNVRMKLNVDLAQRDTKAFDGTVSKQWGGTFDAPDQALKGVPLNDIQVEGGTVKFGLSAGERLLAGTLAPDGQTLTGTYKQPGPSGTFTLKRTGPAKIAEIPASPAVSAELIGLWEGTLKGEMIDAKVALILQNRDEAGQGSFSFADQKLKFPIQKIVQRGSSLAFDMPAFGGVFNGSLSADGNEVTGAVSQGTKTLDVKLKHTAVKID